MKNLLKTLSVIFVFVATFSANAQSGNDNSLIGKARGAAHECLQPYHGSFYQIDASVETIAICFVSGELSRVTFTAGPNCSGPGPCPAFPTRIIATVEFDCEGNVASVTCY
ncbi:MAG: hypothetical protein ACJ76F_06380 [Bacteroidia bacterium]